MAGAGLKGGSMMVEPEVVTEEGRFVEIEMDGLALAPQDSRGVRNAPTTARGGEELTGTE